MGDIQSAVGIFSELHPERTTYPQRLVDGKNTGKGGGGGELE